MSALLLLSGCLLFWNDFGTPQKQCDYENFDEVGVFATDIGAITGSPALIGSFDEYSPYLTPYEDKWCVEKDIDSIALNWKAPHGGDWTIGVDEAIGGFDAVVSVFRHGEKECTCNDQYDKQFSAVEMTEVMSNDGFLIEISLNDYYGAGSQFKLSITEERAAYEPSDCYQADNVDEIFTGSRKVSLERTDPLVGPCELPMKSSPSMNAWASPSGLGCTVYWMLMPQLEPSPSSSLKAA